MIWRPLICAIVGCAGWLAGCAPPELTATGDEPPAPTVTTSGAMFDAATDRAGALASDGPAGPGPVRDAPAPAEDRPPGPDLGRPPPELGGPCAVGAGRPLGAACTCAAECESGACADGVCCNVDCAGPCQSCALAGRLGACSRLAAGAPDPHGRCVKEPPETCGRSGLCDGLGGCARYPAGTNCQPPSCSGSSLVYPYCHPDGTCSGGPPINCLPATCAGGACRLTCASDADCAPGHACVNGSCGLRGLGQSCDVAGQCASGFCADGVCCASSCSAGCTSCALPASRGQCMVVPAGLSDPLGRCQDEGPGSCGSNGRCDGAGGCQKYPAGTVCKEGSCDAKANRWIPDAVCGPSGCTAQAARGCAPFKCAAGTNRCASDCVASDDCVAPSTCLGGSCGKRAPGSLCSKAAECLTGFCARGICCNSACTGSCVACNLPGAVGICTPLPDGAIDPAGACRDEGAASCGGDGTCNGLGSCRKYGPETVCAPASCAKGFQVSASMCDGSGACLRGERLACNPYVCNQAGTGCFVSCHGTGAAPECRSPNLCNNQRCGQAERGQLCSATADCATGLTCASGVCCESACEGPCRTCQKIPGTCTAVAAGTRSAGCPVDPGAPCGNSGRCDGLGSCAQGGTGDPCLAAACTGERDGAGAATCDGAGRCGLAVAFSCAHNRCLSGACAPCASDADCLDGTACGTSGTCGPAVANGSACSAGEQCASHACVDGHCCEKGACGTCEHCGSDGRCSRLTNIPDPDSCPDERATNPCGRSGCDALGGCPLPDVSKIVAGPTCKDATTVVVTTCDGHGGTRSNELACGPGLRCAGGACPAGCTSDGQCAPPYVCTIAPGDASGVCTKRPLGSACQAPGACASGFCADGVCCNEACLGACRRCDSTGLCVGVKSAPDPDTCPDETGAQLCGRVGCDASGACVFRSAGTGCGSPSCAANMLVRPTCDGQGACSPVATDCAATGQTCVANACVSAPDAGSD